MSLSSVGLKVRADGQPGYVISQASYWRPQAGPHTSLQLHLHKAEHFGCSFVSFFSLLSDINMNYSTGRQQGALTAPHDVPVFYFGDSICE